MNERSPSSPVAPLNGSSSTLPRREFVRTALAASLLTMTGCDISVRPPNGGSSQAPEENAKRSEEIKTIQHEISQLADQIQAQDASLATDIRSIEVSLEGKVDIVEAERIVRTAMEKMNIKERVKGLNTRLDEIDGRIKKIEGAFGIVPRTPEAPWYKEAKSQ